MTVFKRLSEWWLYWRYRNITRRWQLLRPRLQRLRRQPQFQNIPARARGTAMYVPQRGGRARGLVFVAVASAILAVLNTAIPAGYRTIVDVLLLAGMAYAYTQYMRI
ncbi:MAG TPA: hypothetical protein VFE42_01420 [Chloroflexota bacterium]|nr:hypothetical protein [Chloroflexota bacterium]